jgi:CRP-like cAMP-binding protein
MNPADLFSRESDPVQLGAGETLFREGDAADAMFVVLEGALNIVVGDKVVEVARRGAVIGEMALIDHSTRGATLIAHEPSTLAKIDERRFQRLIQQNPFFATHVMKVLADRIRKMNEVLKQSKSG